MRTIGHHVFTEVLAQAAGDINQCSALVWSCLLAPTPREAHTRANLAAAALAHEPQLAEQVLWSARSAAATWRDVAQRQAEDRSAAPHRYLSRLDVFWFFSAVAWAHLIRPGASVQVARHVMFLDWGADNPWTLHISSFFAPRDGSTFGPLLNTNSVYRVPDEIAWPGVPEALCDPDHLASFTQAREDQ